jgi:hypothetical protein
LALPKFDISSLLPDGSKVAAHVISYLFLIVMGSYCCFVVAHHGVVSQEARTVFPLLTTLFGGVVGLIVGKAAK